MGSCGEKNVSNSNIMTNNCMKKRTCQNLVLIKDDVNIKYTNKE